MTTPDKEEMPRTAGNFWAEKRDGRWQLQMRHRGPGSSFCVAQINHWADNSEALTTRIANACNAYEPMREALQGYIDNCTNEECEYCIKARAALKGAHQPASDDYQADAGAPALSEKVNARSEWLPIESAPKDGRSILIGGGTYRYSGETFPEDRPYEQVAKAAYVDGEWFGGFGPEYDETYSHSPTHWMPLPSPPGAELNFSNDAERDAVSLKSDTSSQPSSEAGKLSTDEVGK